MFLEQIYQDPKYFQEPPGEKIIQVVLEQDKVFSGNECVFSTHFASKRHITICFICSICLKYILM